MKKKPEPKKTEKKPLVDDVARELASHEAWNYMAEYERNKWRRIATAAMTMKARGAL